MRKCRACVGGAEGRAGVGEAGCAASAQRTQTTGDADLTACARTSRLPARTSRLLARTSRLRARADCVGVRAAARACSHAARRAPLARASQRICFRSHATILCRVRAITVCSRVFSSLVSPACSWEVARRRIRVRVRVRDATDDLVVLTGSV